MTAMRHLLAVFVACFLVLIASSLRADEESNGKKPADSDQVEKVEQAEHAEKEKAKKPESEKTVPYPGDIEDSVVKINVTARAPDYFRPWTKASPSKASGSGVVISGSRILTNAHVVMHASEVLVQLRKGGDQFTAKVKGIAPGIDLAIVELKDPSGIEHIKPIELATDLAEVKSHISVFGYPQ